MSLQLFPGESQEHYSARVEAFLSEMGEVTALNLQPHKSRDERTRINVLLARCAAYKQGFGPDELNRQALHTFERSAGKKPTQFRPDGLFTAEQRREGRAWQQLILETPDDFELRVDTTGNPSLQSPAGFGSWAPVEDWLRLGLIRAMKAADPMLNPDVVTLIVDEGLHSRPIQVPFLSDIELTAAVVGETQQELSTNIANLGGVLLGSFAYRTPAEQVSVESMQDLESAIPAVEIVKQVLCDRYVRGLASDLISGSGIGKPLGLVPSLLALAQNAVGAVAQSTSTIALADLESLFFSVDSAYRNAKKQDGSCAAGWLMNDATALLVAKNQEVSGNARLMSVKDGQLMLFDLPVHIAPSMDNHAAYSHHPIAFGFLPAWVTRINYDNQLRVIREAPNYIEKGIVGIKLFGRGSGVLAFPSDSNSNCPVKLLSSGPSV